MNMNKILNTSLMIEHHFPVHKKSFSIKAGSICFAITKINVFLIHMQQWTPWCEGKCMAIKQMGWYWFIRAFKESHYDITHMHAFFIGGISGQSTAWQNGECGQADIGGTTILVHCHIVKSLQLTWRSGTRRFHLRVPDLQMSCSDLS